MNDNQIKATAKLVTLALNYASNIGRNEVEKTLSEISKILKTDRQSLVDAIEEFNPALAGELSTEE